MRRLINVQLYILLTQVGRPMSCIMNGTRQTWLHARAKSRMHKSRPARRRDGVRDEQQPASRRRRDETCALRETDCSTTGRGRETELGNATFAAGSDRCRATRVRERKGKKNEKKKKTKKP